MEPLQEQQTTEKSRATEIDTGALPLSMDGVLFGLPKPVVRDSDVGSAVSQPWSYGDLVSQKKLLTTLRVTTDVKPGREPIWHFRNTWRNVYETHFRNLEELFMLKSWTLNFLFEFRSNFQQVGQFNLVYTNIPKPLQPYLVGDEFGSYLIQTQLPHQKIFMGEDTNTTVQLKWLSPFKSGIYFDKYLTGIPSDYSSVTDDYDMGTLYLYVPFPMQVATNVDPSMTVRIWTYLSDVDYAGYRISDTIL